MTDAETIAELRAELARVTAALASAEAALLSIREVHMTPGKIDTVMQGQAAHILAGIVAQVWGEGNAKNYLEMSLQCGVQDLIVTIQRKSGKTPHELRRIAEQERDEAWAELARMREAKP